MKLVLFILALITLVSCSCTQENQEVDSPIEKENWDTIYYSPAYGDRNVYSLNLTIHDMNYLVVRLHFTETFQVINLTKDSLEVANLKREEEFWAKRDSL